MPLWVEEKEILFDADDFTVSFTVSRERNSERRTVLQLELEEVPWSAQYST